MQYPVSSTADIKMILGGVTYTREYNALESRQERLIGLLKDIHNRIEWGYIDRKFMDIIWGIHWGITTGRVNSLASSWMSSIRLTEMLDVIQELRESCNSQLDVIFYLNKTIAPQVRQLPEYDENMYPVYKRGKRKQS